MTLAVPTQSLGGLARAGRPDDLIMKLSVQQYHEMIRNGILTEDDRVELLEGWLVAKMSKNPPHVLCTSRLLRILTALLPSGFYIRMQDPITLSESEPEPDLAIVRGNENDYRERHPGPTETPMVVEVADATLDRDRGLKVRTYGQDAIAVYWIVNLPSRQIELYQAGQGSRKYAPPKVFKSGERVPFVLDGKPIAEVEVDSILP